MVSNDSAIGLANYYQKLKENKLLSKYLRIGKNIDGFSEIYYISESVLVSTKWYVCKESIRLGMLNSVSYFFGQIEYDHVALRAGVDFIEPVVNMIDVLDVLIESDPIVIHLNQSSVSLLGFKAHEQNNNMPLQVYNIDDVKGLGDSVTNEVIELVLLELQSEFPSINVKEVVLGAANNIRTIPETAQIIAKMKLLMNYRFNWLADVANNLRLKELD